MYSSQYNSESLAIKILLSTTGLFSIIFLNLIIFSCKPLFSFAFIILSASLNYFVCFFYSTLFKGQKNLEETADLFPCLGYRIQHGLADELGDAVGVGAVAVAVGDADGGVAVAVGGVGGAGVGWRDLVPAVEEAPAFPLPTLTGLAHFYKRINNVFFKETMP